MWKGNKTCEQNIHAAESTSLFFTKKYSLQFSDFGK